MKHFLLSLILTLVINFSVFAKPTDFAKLKSIEYIIKNTFNGVDLAKEAQTVIVLRDIEGSNDVEMTIEAPYYGDPAPEGESGKPVFGLWNYEVVEVFFLNDKDQYLEVEVGPNGHHLVLLLNGQRKTIRHSLDLEVETTIEGGKWKANVVIPADYLPPQVTRFNAYAIHGVEDEREYQALYPAHSSTKLPDFHDLRYFQKIDLTGIHSSNTEELSTVWKYAVDGIFRYEVIPELMFRSEILLPSTTVTLQGFQGGVEVNYTIPTTNEEVTPKGVMLVFKNQQNESVKIQLPVKDQHIINILKDSKTLNEENLVLDYYVDFKQLDVIKGSALVPPPYFPPNVTMLDIFAIFRVMDVEETGEETSKLTSMKLSVPLDFNLLVQSNVEYSDLWNTLLSSDQEPQVSPTASSSNEDQEEVTEQAKPTVEVEVDTSEKTSAATEAPPTPVPEQETTVTDEIKTTVSSDIKTTLTPELETTQVPEVETTISPEVKTTVQTVDEAFIPDFVSETVSEIVTTTQTPEEETVSPVEDNSEELLSSGPSDFELDEAKLSQQITEAPVDLSDTTEGTTELTEGNVDVTEQPEVVQELTTVNIIDESDTTAAAAVENVEPVPEEVAIDISNDLDSLSVVNFEDVQVTTVSSVPEVTTTIDEEINVQDEEIQNDFNVSEDEKNVSNLDLAKPTTVIYEEETELVTEIAKEQPESPTESSTDTLTEVLAENIEINTEVVDKTPELSTVIPSDIPENTETEVNEELDRTSEDEISAIKEQLEVIDEASKPQVHEKPILLKENSEDPEVEDVHVQNEEPEVAVADDHQLADKIDSDQNIPEISDLNQQSEVDHVEKASETELDILPNNPSEDSDLLFGIFKVPSEVSPSELTEIETDPTEPHHKIVFEDHRDIDETYQNPTELEIEEQFDTIIDTPEESSPNFPVISEDPVELEEQEDTVIEREEYQRRYEDTDTQNQNSILPLKFQLALQSISQGKESLLNTFNNEITNAKKEVDIVEEEEIQIKNNIPITGFGTSIFPPPHPICITEGLVADSVRCQVFYECVLNDGDWEVYNWRCERGRYFDSGAVACIRGYC